MVRTGQHRPADHRGRQTRYAEGDGAPHEHVARPVSPSSDGGAAVEPARRTRSGTNGVVCAQEHLAAGPSASADADRAGVKHIMISSRDYPGRRLPRTDRRSGAPLRRLFHRPLDPQRTGPMRRGGLPPSSPPGARGCGGRDGAAAAQLRKRQGVRPATGPGSRSFG
jgi:hypothetical protein